MFILRSVALLLTASWVLAASGQVPVGVLEGTVTDLLSGRPLAEATLEIEPGDPARSASSDSIGHFRFADVGVGLYRLRVSLLGYETLVVSDVWVRAGKVNVLRVEVEPATMELATFSLSTLAREEIDPLGVRGFTVEQGLRYPAMFQDPARLASVTPGVASPNDQANHLVVRGNSPNNNAWLLEGAEIVSPNHLGNAGTPTDLPTLSGGGVNILSAQMLGPSRLRTGVSPATYGNALGGLLDMELRRGNARDREWTAQAGLLGLDLATEGPIGSEGRSFYLVNYRYSTIGLLNAMGVDLGDEAITFQDLSFHVGTALGERGELRFFGLGGNSRNVFEADRDTATWEFDKDSKDITYTARTGAVGSTVKVPVGARSMLSGTVVWSATEQEREEEELATDLSVVRTDTARIAERKLSAVAQVEGSVGGRFRYEVGGSAMERTVENLYDQTVAGWLLRPFAQARYALTEHLHATAGLAYSHFTYNGSELLEPRAGLRWRMAKGRAVGVSYGVRGQLPYHQQLNMTDYGFLPGSAAVGLMRSEDLVLGYDHAFNERSSFRFEAYVQQLSQVPVLSSEVIISDPESQGTVNIWDEPQMLPQVSDGEGRNTGIELSMDRAFDRGYFVQANGTVHQSRYTLSGGEEIDARWNSQWMANAMGGREWRKEGEDRVRTWGVSVRVFARGGLRYTPIEVRDQNGQSFPAYTAAPWSGQLGDVFRADLRLYRKMDRKGRTGMWALDLQNLTNRQNEAYVYFDRRKGEVVTKYQLGLIPNLSYRVEF